MKKIVYIILILLLVGCSREEEKTKEKDDIKKPVLEEKKEEYIDDNPIKLGIYLANGNYNGKEIINGEYYTSFTNGVDIGSFEVFYTGDEKVYGTNFKNTWNKYYNDYEEDISKYKIGYNIKFILNDGTNYETTLFEPDIYHFSEYFYIYFYDDVNAPNTFYSHLENVNDNTLMTSVKLYAVGGIDKVENIILTAFTYDEDDFDENGNYRGNSHYTIRIKRK